MSVNVGLKSYTCSPSCGATTCAQALPAIYGNSEVKAAAARRLSVRLFWTLRTNTAYPEIVRIENSPAEALVGGS
jgi:hypothetical protein